MFSAQVTLKLDLTCNLARTHILEKIQIPLNPRPTCNFLQLAFEYEMKNVFIGSDKN